MVLFEMMLDKMQKSIVHRPLLLNLVGVDETGNTSRSFKVPAKALSTRADWLCSLTACRVRTGSTVGSFLLKANYIS